MEATSRYKFYKGSDILGLFKRSKKRDTENIGPDDLLLKALINNETITREKAMTVPAVSGAVDFISGSIACMPEIGRAHV